MLHSMNIRESTLYRLGVMYLAIPMLVFLFCWLRWPFMCLGILLLWFLYKIYRRNSVSEEARGEVVVSLSYDKFLCLLAVLFLWCFFSGLGSLWFQSLDFTHRNAVLRDLVAYGWPVVYGNGSFLCYYFGFWLIPALVGKFVLLAGGTVTQGFAVADKVLLLWAWGGVVLVALLLMTRRELSTWKSLFVLIGVLVGFSGMDILGSNHEKIMQIMHLEWWSGWIQFSSNTTILFWVFNQGIPAWLGTMLVMSRDDLYFDGIICALTAFLAPLPAFGLLGIIMFKFWARCKKENVWKEIFTIKNLAALLFVLPAILFFGENGRTGNGGDSLGVPVFHFLWQVNPLHLVLYVAILFAAIEYLPYLWAIYPQEKNSWQFKAVCVLLPLISVLQLGDSGDFAMRASIPPLFCLMMLVLKHFIADDLPKVRRFALMFVFFLGCFTPATEWMRGMVLFYTHHGVIETTESFFSFGNLESGDENLKNYIMPDYMGCRFHALVGRD